MKNWSSFLSCRIHGIPISSDGSTRIPLLAFMQPGTCHHHQVSLPLIGKENLQAPFKKQFSCQGEIPASSTFLPTLHFLTANMAEKAEKAQATSPDKAHESEPEGVQRPLMARGVHIILSPPTEQISAGSMVLASTNCTVGRQSLGRHLSGHRP